MTTETGYQSSKTARGTKHTCQACEKRFYDLARQPIVCPMCGVEQALAPPAPAPQMRGHTPRAPGWRQSLRVSTAVVEPSTDRTSTLQEAPASADEPASEDGAPADDEVLEQDGEDGELTELLDVEAIEPKEC